jgi:hypothetical protein
MTHDKGSKTVGRGNDRGCWGTFGVAHMHDIVTRVKRTVLAHIVLVGTPKDKGEVTTEN